jgi:hypothetical protein
MRARVTPTRCEVTGKIKYLDKDRAAWAIQKFQERTGRGVRTHAFECQHCGWWHLTRGTGRGQHEMVMAHPEAVHSIEG